MLIFTAALYTVAKTQKSPHVHTNGGMKDTGTIFNHEKKCSSYACYKDKPWKPYVKRSQTRKDKYYVSPLT